MKVPVFRFASQLPELSVHFPAHTRPNVLGGRKKNIKFPLILELQIRGLDFPTEQGFSPFPCIYGAKSLKNYTLKFSAIPGITARSTNFPKETGFSLVCIHHFLPISCFGPKLLHSISQKTKEGHVYIRE
jgi:hypothetical protein